MYYLMNSMGELTEVSQPETLVKIHPSFEATLADIKASKQACWHNRSIGVHGPRGSWGNMGDGGKLVARIPGRLLQALLWAEPDLIRDDAKWYKWLSENEAFDMSKV